MNTTATDQGHRCTCGHRTIAHQYMCATRTNTGRCLASGCWCEAVTEES